jgi:hypothetical protein
MFRVCGEPAENRETASVQERIWTRDLLSTHPPERLTTTNDIGQVGLHCLMGDFTIPNRLHLAMDVYQSLLRRHKQRAWGVGNSRATLTVTPVVVVVVRATPPLLWSDYKVALWCLVHLYRCSWGNYTYHALQHQESPACCPHSLCVLCGSENKEWLFPYTSCLNTVQLLRNSYTYISLLLTITTDW